MKGTTILALDVRSGTIIADLECSTRPGTLRIRSEYQACGHNRLFKTMAFDLEGLPHPTALPRLGLEFRDFVSLSNDEIKEMVGGKCGAGRVERIMIELFARLCKSQEQGLQEKLSRLVFGYRELQTPGLSTSNLTHV